MKKPNLLLVCVASAFLWMCAAPAVKAQTNPGHVFHVMTWYQATNLDSAARADRNTLLKEYFTKVTMKNEFVLHQWSMNHFFTDDSREFIIISEYANWGDIEKAHDRDNELEKQAWPDAQKRNDFMKKMESYFTGHKDAIYSGLPNLVK